MIGWVTHVGVGGTYDGVGGWQLYAKGGEKERQGENGSV